MDVWEKSGAFSPDLERRIERAITIAGGNRSELEAALERAPADQREAVAFLVSQTGERLYWTDRQQRIPDAAVITADLLLASVRLGYQARAAFPWAAEVGEDTFRRFVLAYRMTTEELTDWRSAFWNHPELRPLVDAYATRYRQAGSAPERSRVFREMLHELNTVWVGGHVPYAPRGLPDRNPLQAIEAKMGRCTDETNTLIAVLRTFGIAATGVRCVYWPGASDNHTWATVYDPAAREWLDVDAGQAGSADDPGYFHKFVRDPDRRVAKIYWVVPGEEEGEVRRALVLTGDETYPPAIEKYLIAKPMVDRTDRYADVADLASAELPRETMVWLAVWNSGMWRPIAGARSSSDGRVLFRAVGRGCRYRLMTWTSGTPAYASEVLTVQPGGSLLASKADPLDDSALHAQRALQLLDAGRPAEARDALLKALEIRPDDVETLYNLACACSRIGAKDAALDYLERAVRLGWSNFLQIRHDPDLDPLHGEPRFARLIEGR
jgi:tetratricopeptide (TPR) repeat protein